MFPLYMKGVETENDPLYSPRLSHVRPVGRPDGTALDSL